MKTIFENIDLERLTGIEPEYHKTCLGLLKVLFPELQRVILFGSRARGKFMPGSDVDLALDCGIKIANPRRLVEAKDVINATRFPYQCDLADYQAAQGMFKELIEEEGIIWYQKT